MDPQMDSGYLQPHESLYDDYDILRDLEPQEVIGIMDQLLCFEVGLDSKLWGTKILILITGIIDGMAYGKLPLSDSVHLHIPRSSPMARVKDPGTMLLRPIWHRKRKSNVAHRFTGVLLGSCESL